MHDLVVKDALIYDGLGGAPMHGAVAVKDGRIASGGRGCRCWREMLSMQTAWR